MNETVRGLLSRARDRVTRSRPYHKNDQAWVEQKNGAVVRRHRRLPSPGGPRGRRGALRGSTRVAALRELLPALLQVGLEDAPGRQGAQELPRTRNAMREAPGFRCRDRRDEGSAASGGRRTRPVATSGGNPSHSASPRDDRLWSVIPPAWTFWQQPRRISHWSGYGVATGRSARHTSTRATAGAGLAYAERPIRDRLAACARVARGRAGPRR